MRKGYVSPSLMCVDLMNVQSDIEKLEIVGVDYFHVDMMYNQFVPNIIFIFEIEIESALCHSCIFHNIGNGCLSKSFCSKEFKGSVVQSTFLSFLI